MMLVFEALVAKLEDELEMVCEVEIEDEEEVQMGWEAKT